MSDTTHTRRGLLQSVANPKPDSEYIVQLRHKLAPYGIETANGVELRLFYVPDAQMMTAENYDVYLSHFERELEECATIEELGAMIVDDLNNELVPKWIHLSLSGEHAHAMHRVSYEERQPGWDNVFLLSRLSTIAGF